MIFAGILSQLVLEPAFAASARELSQAELRENVESGDSLSLARVLNVVQKSVDGKFVDARAFEIDGIFYRVLVMLPSGKLASVVVDAKTGKLLPGNSARAKDIRQAARKTSASKGTKPGIGPGNNNAGGNGNGRNKNNKSNNGKSKGGGKGKK